MVTRDFLAAFLKNAMIIYCIGLIFQLRSHQNNKKYMKHHCEKCFYLGKLSGYERLKRQWKGCKGGICPWEAASRPWSRDIDGGQ